MNTTIVEYLYHLPISRCEDNSVSEPHGCESNDKHMSEPSSLSLSLSYSLSYSFFLSLPMRLQLTHRSVFRLIHSVVRAFLIEEQKIVKKVMKAQASKKQ